MSDSILISVKKILGMSEDYSPFDMDVLMHVNTAFSTLNQIGIGPENGFFIEDATATWGDFLGTDPRLNTAKSFICLRVRLIFDPPTTSYAIDSMNKQLEEFIWRLSVYREGTAWVNPSPSHQVEDDLVLDGGYP
jgi:hypothetical protein